MMMQLHWGLQQAQCKLFIENKCLKNKAENHTEYFKEIFQDAHMIHYNHVACKEFTSKFKKVYENFWISERFDCGDKAKIDYL